MLLCEMVHGLGSSPFTDSINRDHILSNIVHDRPAIPRRTSTELARLLQGLLKKKPSNRYGAPEVKASDWLHFFPWEKPGTMQPPEWFPKCSTKAADTIQHLHTMRAKQEQAQNREKCNMATPDLKTLCRLWATQRGELSSRSLSRYAVMWDRNHSFRIHQCWKQKPNGTCQANSVQFLPLLHLLVHVQIVQWGRAHIKTTRDCHLKGQYKLFL